MNYIRVKKSFTLMELLLVIILISSSYLLIFSNSNFKINNEKKISFENLKEFLIENYDFENKLSLVCIEENLDCLIVVDEEVNNELKIKNLFNTLPEVYLYLKNEDRIEFESIKINDTQNDVFFRLDINSDYKVNELILDTLEDKVYVFNSVYKNAKLYNSLSDVFDKFDSLKDDVKDAF